MFLIKIFVGFAVLNSKQPRGFLCTFSMCLAVVLSCLPFCDLKIAKGYRFKSSEEHLISLYFDINCVI